MDYEEEVMDTLTRSRSYKYLNLIIYLNITLMAAVNIMSGKIVQVGVFTLSAASLCIPLAYVIGDTLTEVYGYKQARRATWILMASTALLAVLLQLAVSLPSAPGFEHDGAYAVVLGQVPRVVLGAWVALFCGQFLNDFVLAKMKLLTKGRHLWLRTIGSTVAGQAVDWPAFQSTIMTRLTLVAKKLWVLKMGRTASNSDTIMN